MARSSDAPTLDVTGTRALESWFLGPKGENADELERLVVEAIRDQAFWRRNYHPNDPTHITEEMRRTPEYVRAMDGLKEGYRSLLAFLKKSVPFFSMRYQGHMNWDLTIPGILGYFAGMLYNPNNVAFEGSTATTILELLVGDDLCRMLGYTIPEPTEVERGAVRPWGHITADGTIANIEAIWSARNLKFYAPALQAALREDPALASGRGITVPVPAGGEVPLLGLDGWTLLNLRADDILALAPRITAQFGVPRDAVTRAVNRFSVQSLGIAEFARRFLGETGGPPVFLVSGTKHYSFPKAAAVLGIGADNMLDVPVDLNGRMSIPELRRMLEECLSARRPVYTVVAVIGSTEESAVDPIGEALAVRDELRARGLDFTIHADGAWGGYHASVVREDFDIPEPGALLAAPPPAMPLSRYVTAQFAALGHADSITVDPHKSGYIPYPAGALCYRNSAMRDLVTFAAPVVFHGDAEPTVGIYGIEGSKPGAAAAAVYLSHRVIRPSRSGYGKIIGQALFSCKKLYTRLLTMARPDDRFIVVPIPHLPAERTGGDIEAELRFLRERIDRRTNDEMSADSEALALLGELGPDQNILAYAFNFRTKTGELNRDLASMNRLNSALYRRLSIKPGSDIYGYDLIVSTTDLDKAHYGEAFIESYKERLGVGGSEGGTVTVLRSVVMDPWVTETSRGSFLDVLETEFRKAVNSALEEIEPTRTRGY
jgi:glutamate/tyrosine decarboxylase-like PLP-dependent enzyme